MTAWEHATDAVTLLKNKENLLPLIVKENETILFVFTSATRPYTAEMAMECLTEKGLMPKSVTYQCIAVSEDTEQETIEAAKDADYVIAVSSVFNTGGFNPAADNCVTSRIFDAVIEAAHDSGHKAVFLSGVLPYDAARYQAADAIVLSYDSYGMKKVPTGVTAYIPNLIAGMCCIFGEFEPVGTLPVVIPALDEDYTFTETILFDRGFSLSCAG
ncbi:MAG: glycoside hydrolase family 3 C-terminal domain-containing protein [Oscillospiraceae bacterium]|nr:glycoside hydrolase family 3 C-terminal domain-containing protein [Oscillospiraceae bacterium]